MSGTALDRKAFGSIHTTRRRGITARQQLIQDYTLTCLDLMMSTLWPVRVIAGADGDTEGCERLAEYEEQRIRKLRARRDALGKQIR